VNILFRCDGSLEIGMGHVVRCVALAKYLKDYYEVNIYFAMKKSELGISYVKSSFDVLVKRNSQSDYLRWLEYCIESTNASTLILDVRDGLLRGQLKLLKQRFKLKIVTIDDNEDKRLESDVAFYPPVPQIRNMDWKEFGGELYVGWEYVLLRDNLKKHVQNIEKSYENITLLVMMGGSDKNDNTGQIVNLLSKLNIFHKVLIILGPGYRFHSKLKRRLFSVNYTYEVFFNPNDVFHQMKKADLGIILFGQVAYELAALNIPAMYICQTIDHLESSSLFLNEGIGVPLGLEPVEENLFYCQLKELVNDTNLLKRMHCSLKMIKLSDLGAISKIILNN